MLFAPLWSSMEVVPLAHNPNVVYDFSILRREKTQIFFHVNLEVYKFDLVIWDLFKLHVSRVVRSDPGVAVVIGSEGSDGGHDVPRVMPLLATLLILALYACVFL